MDDRVKAMELELKKLDSEIETSALFQKVNRNLRVTKVVATRSVKGARGDHFAGFAACYDSVQDEPAGAGKDLIDVVDSESAEAVGMTLLEAKVAFYLVARQADIAAMQAAAVNGSIGNQQANEAIRVIKINYGKLIRQAMRGESASPDSTS